MNTSYSMSMTTFQITLQTKEGDDAIHVLRAALKVLLRRFGLRAISVEETKEGLHSVTSSS